MLKWNGILTAAATIGAIVFSASPAAAVTLEAGKTYRAMFDFSAAPDLDWTRISATILGSDGLDAGESYTLGVTNMSGDYYDGFTNPRTYSTDVGATYFTPGSYVTIDPLGYVVITMGATTTLVFDSIRVNLNTDPVLQPDGTLCGGDTPCYYPEYAGAQDLTSFTEVSAVPLPAALPLLAGGLSLFGLLGWRRKQASSAA